MIELNIHQKEEIIEYFKEHCQIYCECGALMKYSYEGESKCPVFDKEYNKLSYIDEEERKELWDAHDVWGSNGDLDIADFIIKNFNITLEELR